MHFKILAQLFTLIALLKGDQYSIIAKNCESELSA